jgi:hypothetical protein
MSVVRRCRKLSPSQSRSLRQSQNQLQADMGKGQLLELQMNPSCIRSHDPDLRLVEWIQCSVLTLPRNYAPYED